MTQQRLNAVESVLVELISSLRPQLGKQRVIHLINALAKSEPPNDCTCINPQPRDGNFCSACFGQIVHGEELEKP